MYEHDCEACVHMGPSLSIDPHKPTVVVWDLYFCKAAVMGPTVIARYGDKGGEYLSFPIDMVGATHKESPLREAYRIAKAKGYIDKTHKIKER